MPLPAPATGTRTVSIRVHLSQTRCLCTTVDLSASWRLARRFPILKRIKVTRYGEAAKRVALRYRDILGDEPDRPRFIDDSPRRQ